MKTTDSFAVNGRGVLLISEPPALQRNPSLSRDDVETALLQRPGIRKVMSLATGMAEDAHMSGTILGELADWRSGGHTDELVRFAERGDRRTLTAPDAGQLRSTRRAPQPRGARLARSVLAAALPLAVLGCASDPRFQEAALSWRAYVEPAPQAPRALARISTDAYTQLSPGDRCLNPDNPAAGSAVSNLPNPLGLVTLHTGSRKGVRGDAPAGLASGEVSLPAGVPVTVYYRNSGSVGTMAFNCRGSAWFVPTEGMHYQVTATIATDLATCGIVVSALTDSGAQPVPVTSTQTCGQ